MKLLKTYTFPLCWLASKFAKPRLSFIPHPLLPATSFDLMTGNIPPYYKEDDITYDIKPLHVNIETLELEYYKKKTMESNPLWVHITDIFQDKVRKRDIVEKLRNIFKIYFLNLKE